MFHSKTICLLQYFESKPQNCVPTKINDSTVFTLVYTLVALSVMFYLFNSYVLFLSSKPSTYTMYIIIFFT